MNERKKNELNKIKIQLNERINMKKNAIKKELKGYKYMKVEKKNESKPEERNKKFTKNK